MAHKNKCNYIQVKKQFQLLSILPWLTKKRVAVIRGNQFGFSVYEFKYLRNKMGMGIAHREIEAENKISFSSTTQILS